MGIRKFMNALVESNVSYYESIMLRHSSVAGQRNLKHISR